MKIIKRILCISDIHGRPEILIKLLKFVNYDSKVDQLILHGDYTDRGYKNIECLELVKSLTLEGAIALKGNHDEMAQYSIADLLDKNSNSLNIQMHVQCGGQNTIDELMNTNYDKLQELYNFLYSLPYIYQNGKYIFVHAGVNASVPLELNSNDDFIWSRDDFIYKKAYDDKIVIFGHTPVFHIKYTSDWKNSRIWIDPVFKDKIGIDCGNVFGGKLACLDLSTLKGYYV